MKLTPEIILKYRKSQGMSQFQFAVLLGVTPLTVLRWEMGKSKPRKETAKRISAMLT